MPDLELVPMPLGWVINEARIEKKYVYFPTTCVVSKLIVMRDGSTAANAIIGSEGAVGITLLMGESSASTLSRVQWAGSAFRMKESVLQREFSNGSVFKPLALRYIMSLIAQLSQTTVCNQLHDLEQRLCLWLLLSGDRLSSNQIAITQESMANMLGVRRESVTLVARQLQMAGVIKYSRGHVTILDRQALEKRGCECYAVLKKESDRLLSYREPQLSKRPLWAITEREKQVAMLTRSEHGTLRR